MNTSLKSEDGWEKLRKYKYKSIQKLVMQKHERQ